MYTNIDTVWSEWHAFYLLSETYTSVLAILKFLLASDVLGSSLFEISKCWENEWNKHNWSSENGMFESEWSDKSDFLWIVG